jgi:hypothetical protein
MGIEALLSTQIIDTTTVGRAVMTAVDAAAARTAIGLGTLATQNGTITDYLTTAAAATTYQPLDGDLTALAALTGTDNLYYRSGAATWSSVTIGTGLTFTGGTLAASGGSGIGGSTGSTDNLVLRADGTGGATLQNSNWSVPDVYTASPNATVNHVSLQATGSTTNVSLSLVSKGSGAFMLQVPDGTSTGGNVRGANAVDLQTSRNAATSVASGSGSFIAGGYNNAATGSQSFAGGYQNTASAQSSFAFGTNSTASSNATVAIGQSCNASGYASHTFGFGANASAFFSGATGFRSSTAIPASKVHAAGYFTTEGDTQEFVGPPLRATTTDGTTAVQMLANSTDNATATGISVASGRVMTLILQITGVKNGGATVARFTREVTIKNVGGTTSLVGTVNTIGTDEAAGTTISITADDTNDKLQVAVTGVASETWRWQCISRGGQLTYG